jgi:hypothetical protein
MLATTISVTLIIAAAGYAAVPGNSLNVHPPRHARESLDVRHFHSFIIIVTGSARRADDLYVFQEGAGGCAALPAELELAQDAQQLYYRFAVDGQFTETTAWDAFRDAGRHWACTYLATDSGRVALNRFVPFTVTAPPIGRLKVHLPGHPQAGHRYDITLTGVAANTDSLWIYTRSRGGGACLSWYVFRNSTYKRRHAPYHMFSVHGKFTKRTSWAASRRGRYRACAYLVETKAYPQRILNRAATYAVS